jgi:hypothetical protein
MIVGLCCSGPILSSPAVVDIPRSDASRLVIVMKVNDKYTSLLAESLNLQVMNHLLEMQWFPGGASDLSFCFVQRPVHCFFVWRMNVAEALKRGRG